MLHLVARGLYCILAGVPFSYAIFSNVIMRRMETAVFARYRNQLLSQIEDLSEMVYRDELTGLYNRRHFYEVARVEIEKSKISKRPLAIVIMDLDRLKVINDEHGHNVGDAASPISAASSPRTRARMTCPRGLAATSSGS